MSFMTNNQNGQQHESNTQVKRHQNFPYSKCTVTGEKHSTVTFLAVCLHDSVEKQLMLGTDESH